VERTTDYAKPARSKASDTQRPKPTSNVRSARSARKQPPKLFLKDSEVAERYSVSRPTVWRWAKSRPGFPHPVAIAEGTTRWAISALEAFERSLKAAVQTASSGGAA
jgi:predicted DNA-binding transcriptional regulator AlpA